MKEARENNTTIPEVIHQGVPERNPDGMPGNTLEKFRTVPGANYGRVPVVISLEKSLLEFLEKSVTETPEKRGKTQQESWNPRWNLWKNL